MLIKINGQEIELPEGSTVKDAIKATKAPHIKGSVISVIKGKEEFEKHINKYKIKTTAGSIIIEILEDEKITPLIKAWRKNYKKFNGQRIRWTTPDEVAIGPIKTELEPTHKEFQYNKNEVILSLSGFSPESTHVIFSKDQHKAIYGAPPHNRGVFAKIIGGMRTLLLLTEDDHIKEVKPIIERRSIVKSAAVTDLNTILKDGNQVFTYVKVKPDKKSPESVEHFFSLLEDGKVKVDYESNSFIGFYALEGIKKGVERIEQRKRGTVTLRNRGRGVGRVYIYREDRVSTPSHNYIGTVQKGMELVDIARKGDHITIKCEPGRIMTVNMTQKQAEEYLQEHHIKQIRDGLKDDKAIIVKQEPKYTMDILKEKKVKTFGIEKDKLIEIEMDEKAPRSTWYFKKISGLVDSPIGSMKVHFAFPGMKVVMFEGDKTEAKGIVPENTPTKCVKAGEIGVTNMSRHHVGLIGVRLEDNDEFGPTGEPFNATNIIGKVTKGLKNIEKFKEGDTVYVREKK
ncbi:MAG TPA: methanogenesis marker 3 protein [Methanothermobacter sp.]|nr:conserved hypothetical protein [Methanothermobacter sp. MT-2]HHW04882.1 methanogenesis marker 3 protein [Methanothermobacter sp.]HOK73241.1 methanogenesis marker 3 protein [Methanothermobacter sp.]HOL69534.1 methanogenesis marker 3 protein [Methanothermobacter sp.]HPQ05105.1 methanogenesis marker 3 protein [Methanothermobacter sp.]